MSLRLLSRFDRIATRAPCSGTEALSVCSRDSLPLYSSSLKRHWWWWQGVSFCRWPVHNPFSISNSPRDSDHMDNGLFVPPVLMFYPADLSRTRHTFCRRREALGTAVSHSQPTLRTCIWDSFCSTVLRFLVSPTPSLRMAQTPVQASCHAIFRVASDRLDPSGTRTTCFLRVPPTTARSGSLPRVLLACSSPCGT